MFAIIAQPNGDYSALTQVVPGVLWAQFFANLNEDEFRSTLQCIVLEMREQLKALVLPKTFAFNGTVVVQTGYNGRQLILTFNQNRSLDQRGTSEFELEQLLERIAQEALQNSTQRK